MVDWGKLSTFTQAQWKEYLQNLVRTNKKALYRAIVVIADYQTPEEKAWGMTIDHNGVGFGAVDAEMMTALALRLKNGGELTERELAICRNKMPKYWRQLMILSKRRMEHERKSSNEGRGDRSEGREGHGLGSNSLPGVPDGSAAHDQQQSVQAGGAGLPAAGADRVSGRETGVSGEGQGEG